MYFFDSKSDKYVISAVIKYHRNITLYEKINHLN
jgi:hypothetical protein